MAEQKTDNTNITSKKNVTEDKTLQPARSSDDSQAKGISWEDVVNIVKSLYHDLLHKTIVIPPLHFNKVPYVRESLPGSEQSVLVKKPPSGDEPPEHGPLPFSNPSALDIPGDMWTKGPGKPVRVRESDLRDDIAQNTVMHNLQALGDSQEEVMFILSQLSFGDYLNQPTFAAAADAAKLPRPSELNTKDTQYTDGEVDFLVIHRHYGILIGELKSVGKKQQEFRKDKAKAYADIAKKIKQAAKQLNRSAEVVRYLVSDSAKELPLRTTLFLPYVTRDELKKVLLTHPQAQQALSTSLGAINADHAVKLSCCSDLISDPNTCNDDKPSVLESLTDWWKIRMTNMEDLTFTDKQYLDIVARFVGPATMVKVHCNLPIRVEVRTLGQAVAELGWRLAQLILTQNQIKLMQKNPLRVCITGPPGTGKTVVLVLQAVRWLLEGLDVQVVSTSSDSRAVSILIKQQCEKTTEENAAKRVSSPEPGKVAIHNYNFLKEEQLTLAVNELSQAAGNRPLCVILDEAIFSQRLPMKQDPVVNATNFNLYLLCRNSREESSRHSNLVKKLKQKYPDLRFWAACVPHTDIPEDLPTEKFVTPLRCAPVVLKELKSGIERYKETVDDYTPNDIPFPGDGCKVIRLYHNGSNHTSRWPVDCQECGRNIAKELQLLHVSTNSSRLQYSDVFILTRSSELQDDIKDDTGNVASRASGVVQGLRENKMPVCVLGDKLREKNRLDWEKKIEEMALAKSNTITVARWGEVNGTERRIVVTLQGELPDDVDRPKEDIPSMEKLHAVSRCTTQLITVRLDKPSAETSSSEQKPK